MAREIGEKLIHDSSDELVLPSWRFCAFDGTEILRIDETGMTYKGKLIEDAGEAHEAFLEAMAVIKSQGRVLNGPQ